MDKLINLLKKNRFTFLVYALLALTILFPLLGKGYVLTLDMVFTPKVKLAANFFESGIINNLLFFYILKTLSFILPVWIIQKIILFMIFFVSGFSMHILVSKFVRENFKTNKITEKAAYFSGILYMINPFTYERFLAGQWTILLGYSFLPVVLFFLFKLEKDASKKNVIILSLVFAILGAVNLHMVFIALFLVALLSASFFIFNKSKKYLIAVLSSFSVFILLSIYWIIPLIFNNRISSFSGLDIELFKTVPDKTFGFLGNVLAMYGFWKEPLYNPPKYFLGYIWPFMALVIIGLSFFGFYKIVKNKKSLAGFAAIFVFVIFMSIGNTTNITKPFYNFFFYYIPGFRGFREPQKFVSLLVLFYAFFGGLGLAYLADVLKKRNFQFLFFSSSLLIILIYTFSIFGGVNGQLKVSDYPVSWYEANEFLNNDSQDFKALFLPWHEYMVFNFASTQTLANPANQFFDKDTIQGDNVEMKGTVLRSGKEQSKIIENLIKKKSSVDWGVELKNLNVKYVILSRSADWQDYSFLNNQSNLKNVFQGSDLAIFRNIAF